MSGNKTQLYELPTDFFAGGFAVLVPLVSLLVYSLLAYISIQLIVGVRHVRISGVEVQNFDFLTLF